MSDNCRRPHTNDLFPLLGISFLQKAEDGQESDEERSKAAPRANSVVCITLTPALTGAGAKQGGGEGEGKGGAQRNALLKAIVKA